jgi:Ca-activated chloride channel family protein
MKVRVSIGISLALGSVLALLGGCSARDQTASSAARTAPATVSLAAPSTPAVATKSLPGEVSENTLAAASPTMQDQNKQAFEKSRMATGYAPASGSFSGGSMAGRGQMAASVPPAAASTGRPATYNPNMYVSSNYLGGNGEKERLEKLIQAGVVVDGKRVKLESFVRTYAQAFPIPTQTALGLNVDTERATVIQEGDHTYLQIGIQAMKGETPRRPPLNIALVIDRSGSMGNEHKLDFVKSAVVSLLDHLGPNDVFSLIAFDDTAQILVPAQRGANRDRIKQQIAALAPGGGTNIYDGLSLGYREAAKNRIADGVNRVILLSDGEVTAGIQDPHQFQQLVSGVSADRDIQTSAIGVGVEFNEDLMLGIARDGKGSYHFLRDGADTRQVFARELDDLTHVVAKAIQLRIRLADGVGLVRVLGSATLDSQQTARVKADEKRIDRKVAEELGITANRQHAPDEPGIKMLIPDFYRGDSHVVMLEITVPRGQGTCKIADVFLKYKDLAFKANRETRGSVAIQYTPNRADMIASIHRNVKKNLLGFQTGEALTDAAALIAQGRVAEAIRKVDERMTVLGVAAREWHDRDLDGDGRLLNSYKMVLAQLNTNQQLARGEFGEYLRRSLTYNGYQMTQ